jgi:hypothetical protein
MILTCKPPMLLIAVPALPKDCQQLRGPVMVLEGLLDGTVRAHRRGLRSGTRIRTAILCVIQFSVVILSA